MLTRDEIMSMQAGRELDALVAEHVMGQTNFNHPGFFWEEGMMEDGDGWDGFYCPRCHSSESEKVEKCAKRYSASIADAWQVVEKVIDLYSIPGYYGGERTGTLGIYISRTRATDFDKTYYQAYFRQQGGQDKKKNAVSSMGDTLPLAICRAALMTTIR